MNNWKRLCWLAPILLLTGCVLPPIVYQTGLPAHAPTGPLPEVRGGFSSLYWFNAAGGPVGYYFHGGVRVGQYFTPLVLEEGVDAFGDETNLNVGLHVGTGLRDPTVMLRGSLYPLVINSSPQFDIANAWWQVEALTGSRPKPREVNWSAGAVASRLGIGPTVLAENDLDWFRLRGQLSLTFRPPWQDAAVRGHIFTLGVTAAFQP